MAKKVSNSRPARWARAVTECQEAITALQAAKDQLEGAISNLDEIKSEYQDWLDNLPENLQNSGLSEKLTAVCDLELSIDSLSGEIDDVENVISEAEGIDLPLGFGRD